MQKFKQLNILLKQNVIDRTIYANHCNSDKNVILVVSVT